MIYRDQLSTPLGTLTLEATDRGLSSVRFPNRAGLCAGKSPNNPVISQAKRELTDYFAGELKQFSVPLDWQGTDFQQSVLRAGLSLLESGVPEFVHFGEVVRSDEVPMACALPPRDDPDAPAAVDEARGFRAAYRRAVEARGVSAVGRVIEADMVPEALAVLDAWASGMPWTEMALPGKNTVAVCHDIRAYYLEAALELVGEAAPGGRSFDAWFHEVTAAGRTVLAARRALRDQGAPFPFWFYMAPGHLE